jgi:hypothetical protein
MTNENVIEVKLFPTIHLSLLSFSTRENAERCSSYSSPYLSGLETECSAEKLLSLYIIMMVFSCSLYVLSLLLLHQVSQESNLPLLDMPN